MNVLLLPADESACRLYRLRAPADAAEALGLTATVGEPVRPIRTPLSGELPVVLQLGEADVVVLHRPAFPAVVDLIPRLQAEGRAVVVDVDDDLAEPPEGHPWRLHKRHLHGSEQGRACKLADLVTCTTDALRKRYGAHGRVQVLPNCIPRALLELPRASDGHTIGWAGSASGHPGDLPATNGAINAALNRSDWRFKLIGDPETVASELGLTTPFESTGVVSIEEYQRLIGSFDIGIVPLADVPFSRARSYLKGLEYAARGVPFVASDLPEYRKLAAEGVGLLAKTPTAWRKQLRQLMCDESLRHEMAARGREVLAAGHTYETQGHLWAEAWQTAIDNRKRSSR